MRPEMAVESTIFSSKKSPHKFSDTDPSNLIISRFLTWSVSVGFRLNACLYDKMVRKSDIERRGIEHSRISAT